jgi:hypothetical protein
MGLRVEKCSIDGKHVGAWFVAVGDRTKHPHSVKDEQNTDLVNHMTPKSWKRGTTPAAEIPPPPNP